jgi:ATP-dependent exoDNAse (exonuclease V) beta subunit
MKGQAFDDDMNKKTLFGKIDLLVLDKNGKYHIIDYKTSIKKYENFDLTKKEAYSY